MVILDIILCQAGSEEVGCVIKLSRLETCGDVWFCSPLCYPMDLEIKVFQPTANSAANWSLQLVTGSALFSPSRTPNHLQSGSRFQFGFAAVVIIQALSKDKVQLILSVLENWSFAVKTNVAPAEILQLLRSEAVSSHQTLVRFWACSLKRCLKTAVFKLQHLLCVS